jgi:hypothetical protein
MVMDANESVARCELCGEPMPPGEDMFKFHGYSGPCPKPPLEKPKPPEVMAEFVHYEHDGMFILETRGAGQVLDRIAFNTASERYRAYEDLLVMLRSIGAKIPNKG